MNNILLWFGLCHFFLILIMFKIFYTALEKKRPEKFKELGKPSLFSWINRPESELIVYSFIRKREYTNLNNRKINIIGNIVLLLMFMGPAFYLLLFLLAVFFF